jgi:nitrogen regulatory protein PII
VVRDGDVGTVTRLICKKARTGKKRDGLVFVCPVDDVIHIRTGISGEASLEPTGAPAAKNEGE